MRKTLMLKSLLVGALGCTAASDVLADEPVVAQSGQRHALIMIGKPAGEPSGEAGRRVADQITSTLRRTGFSNERINTILADGSTDDALLQPQSLKKQLQSLSDSASADDVLVVFVVGQGLVTAEGDAVDLSGGQSVSNSITIGDMLTELGTSACRRQFLLIDGSGANTARGLTEDRQFGLAKPAVQAGQVVLLGNYVAPQNASADGFKRRGFLDVVLDGLTELADQDSDGQVQSDEVTEYVVGYFKSHSLIPIPADSGRLAEDFVVSIPDKAGASDFQLAQRNEISRRMLQNAHQLLLIEQQPLQAMEMLQRALSYKPEARLARRIRGMWHCCIASTGNPEEAWTLARKDGGSLLVWVPEAVQLKTPAGTVTASGELLELVELDAAAREFRVGRRMTVKARPLEMELLEVKSESDELAISITELETAAGRQDPDLKAASKMLLKRLGQLEE
ncbi:MAG: hypothetical protein RLZZ458_3067 [Planctomycetota bacterium]